MPAAEPALRLRLRLRLRLTAIRYAARGVHLYEFRAPDGSVLPPFTPGAHVDLLLGNGMLRQYSLTSAPDDRRRYVVGVKRDPASRGGSAYIHDLFKVGALVDVSPPRNHFELHYEAPHSVLIAGGIGITPIACMAQALRRGGRSWKLHYSVRERDEAAFETLRAEPQVRLHVDAESGGAYLDVAAIVRSAPATAQLYCCGPGPMLDAFETAARAHAPGRWHVERFSAAQPSATAGGFTVRLAVSGRSVAVAPGQTILDTLRDSGIEVPASCEQGICGTCETRVLAGVPDHRDSLLSDAEKAANNVMMVCCSGSLSDVLVLDL